MIDKLLNALDEAKGNRNDYLGFTAKEWHEKGGILKNGLEKALADCMIDRDCWKARAEALERAIHRLDNDCPTCVFRDDESATCCDNDNDRWQFDEARFAVGTEG